MFIIFIILCSIAAYYLIRSLVQPLPFKRRWRVLIALPILLICYLFPLALIRQGEWMPLSMVQLANGAAVMTCYMVSLAVLKDVLFLLPKFILKKKLVNAHLVTAPLIIVVSFVLSLWGYHVAYDTKILQVDIPIPAKAASLADLRIVQLSDIHVTKVTPKAWLEGIVTQTNALTPDIICITGDIADLYLPDTDGLMAPLTQLKAKYGVYFVDGNHEYHMGQIAEWRDMAGQLGFIELHNSHRLIEHKGQKLQIAGVPDKISALWGQGEWDVAQAIACKESPDLSILLAHRPEIVTEAAKLGVNIQMSGHTHGGQFFPWNIIVGLAQEYLKGLYQVEQTQLYVNQGTGFWAIPSRLGTLSEITLFKLVPQL